MVEAESKAMGALAHLNVATHNDVDGELAHSLAEYHVVPKACECKFETVEDVPSCRTKHLQTTLHIALNSILYASVEDFFLAQQILEVKPQEEHHAKTALLKGGRRGLALFIALLASLLSVLPPMFSYTLYSPPPHKALSNKIHPSNRPLLFAHRRNPPHTHTCSHHRIGGGRGGILLPLTTGWGRVIEAPLLLSMSHHEVDRSLLRTAKAGRNPSPNSKEGGSNFDGKPKTRSSLSAAIGRRLRLPIRGERATTNLLGTWRFVGMSRSSTIFGR